MANSLSASFEEIWAKEQQTVFYKTNVAMAIADTSFNGAMMNRGDTLNRTKRSALAVKAYTRGTAMTATDITDSLEQLSVDKQFYVMVYVDDFDQIQDKYDIAMSYGKDAGEALSAQVDAHVLGEVFNAASTIDDGTIGGGGIAGNGITASTSNILKIFGAARKKLRLLNVTSNDLFATISPDLEDVLFQNDAARVTDLGDDAYRNGYIGKLNGFKLYETNNLSGSAVLSLATLPTNGDTVVIEGVTFTFVSSIGTTAGNVLIGANVAASRTNLNTLLNAPATTTSTGVALSTANSDVFLANVTSAIVSSTVVVKYKGVGTITVSETLTDATDTWTAAKIKQHALFGVVGNPVLVMQKNPSVAKKDVQDKFGKNVMSGTLYGVKTFTDNATQMVNVELRADAW